MRRFLRICILVIGVALFVEHLAVLVAIAIWDYQPPARVVAEWTSIACMAVAIRMIFDREPAE